MSRSIFRVTRNAEKLGETFSSQEDAAKRAARLVVASGGTVEVWQLVETISAVAERNPNT